MSTWERLAELPVEIEDYTLEALSARVSSDFDRASTVIHLRGGELSLGFSEPPEINASQYIIGPARSELYFR